MTTRDGGATMMSPELRDAREGLRCGENRTRAYWHGWRNGMIDSGKMQPDAFGHLLAKDMRARGLSVASIAGIHREKFEWLREIGLA